MIKKLSLILLILIPSLVFAQKILMEEDVAGDTVRPTRGPNLSKYTHVFMNFGMPVYKSVPGAEVNPVGSLAFAIGVRNKYKLCNYNSVGFDLAFDFKKYSMKQTDQKVLPDDQQNDRELFRFSSVGVGIYDRITVGRRGNILGKYLDIAAWGSYNFLRRHETRNKNEDGEKIEVRTSRLAYANHWVYGLEGRLGWNWIALKASYRLSDYFTASPAYPELPRLGAGIEFMLPGK